MYDVVNWSNNRVDRTMGLTGWIEIGLLWATQSSWHILRVGPFSF